jgi:hypothetical protein
MSDIRKQYLLDQMIHNMSIVANNNKQDIQEFQNIQEFQELRQLRNQLKQQINPIYNLNINSNTTLNLLTLNGTDILWNNLNNNSKSNYINAIYGKIPISTDIIEEFSTILKFLLDCSYNFSKNISNNSIINICSIVICENNIIRNNIFNSKVLLVYETNNNRKLFHIYTKDKSKILDLNEYNILSIDIQNKNNIKYIIEINKKKNKFLSSNSKNIFRFDTDLERNKWIHFINNN